MKIYNLNIKKRRCEMHACMRNVMRLSRWAGFFPVEGLDNSYNDGLRYKLQTVYSVYNIATIFGQFMATGFALYVIFTEAILLANVVTFLFYATALISSFFLLRLAQIWPSLISKASEIECRLPDIHISRDIEVKSNIMAYVIMSLGTVEHILCIVFHFKLIMSCMEETQLSLDVFENVIIFRMSFIFNYTSFDIWKGVFSKVVDIQATFMWSFMDVMVTSFSIYVAEYFKQLNSIINSRKLKTAETWEKIRLNYSHLVDLVKEIDAHTSHCVLLCLFTDLFFICIQLFNTLNKDTANILEDCKQQRLYNALHSSEHMFYFTFSFLFLVARVLVLSLLTANVNSVAQEPINALGEVPASTYNISIQRFYRQINYTTIAISGLFFKVTRTMIINVVGTIITYELVLLQFNRSSKNDVDETLTVTSVINDTMT